MLNQAGEAETLDKINKSTEELQLNLEGHIVHSQYAKPINGS